VAPYEPFREVLRAALLGDGDEGHEADHVIARVLRELPGCGEHLAILLGLMSLRSDAYPFPAADAERSQTAILAALQAVLGQLAETRPVVVVLTDWHWADAASEHALDHLVEGIASRRLLLVVNFRSHYQPPWATSAVRLDLPPLGVDDARPIVQRIVGDGASADLVQRIYERTGGNPLFVEELSRTLADLGSTGATDAETLVDGVVPDNVAAVLRARIDRLPPACIEVLKVASVIGESFALAVLRDVSELERVDAAIDELVHAGLVQPVDGDGLRFKHALVRDVAYELLLLRRRRALHGAVGCVIERREADRLDEHVERLAHHFARSDDLDKAVLYLVRSGDKAGRDGRDAAGARPVLRSGAHPRRDAGDPRADARSRRDHPQARSRGDLPAFDGAARDPAHRIRALRTDRRRARGELQPLLDGVPRECARRLAGRARAVRALSRAGASARRRQARLARLFELRPDAVQHGRLFRRDAAARAGCGAAPQDQLRARCSAPRFVSDRLPGDDPRGARSLRPGCGADRRGDCALRRERTRPTPRRRSWARAP
jgi:hypothetical protein